MSASPADIELINEREIQVKVPARFNAVVFGIETLKDRYSGLTIAGAADKDGYKAVSTAVSDIREKRGVVERTREALKQPFLDTGRAIDAEAKRITAELLGIEEPLKLEKKRIDDEKLLIKQEEETELNRLAAVASENIARMSREQAEQKEAEQRERNRILEKENADLKARMDKQEAEAKQAAMEQKAIEDKRLAYEADVSRKQNEELEKLRAENAKMAQAAIDAEAAKEKTKQDLLDAEQREKDHVAAAEKDRLDKIAAEKLAEEARIEKAAQLLQDQQHREMLKIAIQPDLDTLIEYAAALDISRNLKIEHPIAKAFASEINAKIAAIVKEIYTWTGE
ncbi:MAG: hypothetical protein QX197_15430 [Methylococcaceae bacterium]